MSLSLLKVSFLSGVSNTVPSCDSVLKASDIGDSMVVHAFGAYFGLTVSRVIHKADDVRNAEPKEGSVYHSDLFAMIGNFSWITHAYPHTFRSIEYRLSTI